jgi:flagellar hook protein FlgE
MLDSKNNPSYTRDGQFSLSKDGYVVNSTGDYLTGYAADDEGKLLLTGTATKLRINTSDSKPVATTAATLNLNLNSGADAIPTATTFDPKIASSYTHSTTTTVFDAKGQKHDVQSFYIKRDATNWDVEVTVDGVKQGSTTKLTFDSSGKLTTPSTKTFNVTIGSSTPAQTVAFDLSSTVQFGSPFAATMSQNGNDVGQMTGYKVGADGVIKAQYSNGQSMLMGQIILYNFKNLNGLAPTQNNQWVETAASGAAIAGTPGSMGLGSLQGSSTEDSNVDLTVEMIKLISAQRAFQAASEVVKKQDEILQGVVHIGG